MENVKPMQPKKSEPTVIDEIPRIRRIGSLVNQLISRRGYAQVVVVHEIQETVTQQVDASIRSGIRVGNLKKGVLDIYAADSVTLQELNFQKRTILKKIKLEHPQTSVTDLKFRIQA